MQTDPESDPLKSYYTAPQIISVPNQGNDRLHMLDTNESFSKNTRLPLFPTSTHASYLSSAAVAVAAGASRPGSIIATASGTQTLQPRSNTNGVQQQYAIPSVKPVVDQHDRMWAELDVLDEVEIAASETEANMSFFGDSHAKVLAELQQSQLELIKSISVADKRVEKDQYQSLWEQNDIESLRNNLFNQQHFDSIYKHVSKTIEKLDGVAEKMKEIDKDSQEMWQSN